MEVAEAEEQPGRAEVASEAMGERAKEQVEEMRVSLLEGMLVMLPSVDAQGAGMEAEEHSWWLLMYFE